MSDRSQVTGLLATFDPASTATFQDVTALLNADGTFSFDESQLGDLTYDGLVDGAYTLRLQVQTATNQTIEKSIQFQLDRSAPTVSLPDVIDGIAWERGMHFLGTVQDNANAVQMVYEIARASDGQSVAQHSFTVAGSLTGTAFDQVLDELTSGNSVLQDEEVYNLIVTSTDVAGNAQRTRFQFFIPGDRRVVDDDPWISPTNPNDPPTDPRTPIPGVTPTAGNLSSWGYVGSGGGWGYYGGSGSGGGWTPGYDGQLTPEGKDDHRGLTGTGYEYEYAESVDAIVRQAVDLISTSPATIHQKAALQNRQNILLAIGDRLNTLIQADGNFANDQALIDQMRPAMEGLFADAYDPNGYRAGVYDTFVPWGGAWLAQELVQDSRSVREQVFQATLLEVVTETFATRQIAMSQTQQSALTAAVLELAKTYTWLNPNPETTVPTEGEAFGFLDLLWRLQVPDANGQFKGSGDITAALGQAVTQLGQLLEGVNDPVRAIQFINNLMQTASNVPVLKNDLRDTEFLKKIVEFGLEVAKVNPQITTSDQAGLEEWLEIMWEGNGNKQLATGGIAKFLDQPGNLQDRLERLDYSIQLVKAVELVNDPDVKPIAHSSEYLSYAINLGSSYAALKPNTDNPDPGNASFLQLVAQNDFLAASDELERQISKALAGLKSIYKGETSVIKHPDGRISIGSDGYKVLPGNQVRAGFNLTNSDPNDDLFPIVYRVQRQDGSVENPVPGDTLFTLYSQRSTTIDPHGLYPGDKLLYATDDSNLLGQNQFKDLINADYSATQKVFDALRLAPFIAGPQIEKFTADIANLVTQHPVLTGVALGAFIGVQLSPLALPLNAGLILLGGWQTGLSLGSFFYNAANAQNQTQLFDAARDFNNAIANLIGLAGSGGLLKLNLSEGFRNVWRVFDAGLEIWNRFKALDEAPSFAQGIAIVIDKFKDADTAIGRLLQYGDEGVKAFLNESSTNLGKFTLEGLTDFASRVKKLFEIASRLDENSDVVAFLLNNRNLVKSILDEGTEAVDDLANLLRRSELATQDLQELLGIQDISPNILRQLLDDEGLTVAEIKAGFIDVCFVAGTKVLTPLGEKPIESLAVGELVLASDPESGIIKPCSILQRFERESPTVFDIQLGSEVITCTPEHPFWIPNQGWQSARQLKVGTPLLTHNGEVHLIESIQCREGLFKVYNIEVEELHTYYVSSLQVLVHNECDLRPVSRLSSSSNPVLDSNGQPIINLDGHEVRVYGQTGSSSTTDGHPEAMVNTVRRAAATGEYEYFTYQRSLWTATGHILGQKRVGPRPDVIGVRRDGKIDIWEVRSQTQTEGSSLGRQLENQTNSLLESLPIERQGEALVIPPEPNP